MKAYKKVMIKIAFAASLVALAVAFRIFNNDYRFAPNLEVVTALSVLAGISLGYRYGFGVALSSMIASDMIIGNSSIFVYTWSSFAFIGLSAGILKRFDTKPFAQIISSGIFAIASSFGFFVITNLGVWIEGWYPMTVAGLVECFTLAIPFYRTMLIGNLIIVPAIVSVYQLVRIKVSSNNLVINTLIGK